MLREFVRLVIRVGDQLINYLLFFFINVVVVVVVDILIK